MEFLIGRLPGNGGPRRPAASFMESMASLSRAAHAYGIRYDHGLFRQYIKDGWQMEAPENWLASGNPWEFERPEVLFDIAPQQLQDAGRVIRPPGIARGAPVVAGNEIGKPAAVRAAR